MKRMMVAVAVALASMMAIAAQCEGKTQKGERCKREAAEGSKFCIGHADQAKKPEAKEKDSGQCWAVTEAGTRCKHKKDGESDYCKQHAPSVKPSKPIALAQARGGKTLLRAARRQIARQFSLMLRNECCTGYWMAGYNTHHKASRWRQGSILKGKRTA